MLRCVAQDKSLKKCEKSGFKVFCACFIDDSMGLIAWPPGAENAAKRTGTSRHKNTLTNWSKNVLLSNFFFELAVASCRKHNRYLYSLSAERYINLTETAIFSNLCTVARGLCCLLNHGMSCTSCVFRRNDMIPWDWRSSIR